MSCNATYSEIRDNYMFPEIETQRLHLREVVLEDGPALQSFQNSAEQWQYQAVEPGEYSDCTLRVCRYMEHRGTDEQRYIISYVAIEKSSNTIIGEVSLSRSHPAIANIGFGLAKQQFGKGYAAEMVNRYLAFGFSEFKLHRIVANVAVENKPCIRVLEKLGMVYEGTSRECIWAQQKWWTEAQYAMLEKEYRS